MLRSTLLSALALGVGLPAASETLIVTSNSNDGVGTLRAALASAQESGAPSRIVIETGDDIEITDPLVYAGRDPLAIVGGGQTISTDRNITLLAVTNGADLDVSGLNFQGPGGFDIAARAKGPAGKGIFVDVPVTRSGTVALSLDRVTVSGVAGYGIHVSDCDLAEACGSGGGGAGDGSDASISVKLHGVTVTDVGNGGFDADGLRVDERGPGDITAHIDTSSFTSVGADGVELDEGQAGSVLAQVTNTRFENNGIYCDPDVLASFLPNPAEMEFTQSERAQTDIPHAVKGSPDDACIEREVDLFDDGSVEAYEFGIDVDDGFDVDEAGPGGITATLVDVRIVANLDEGLDFDEEGAGGINLTLLGGRYALNSDDGIKLSEEDAGDVTVRLLDVAALDNGGKGIVLEQEDAGRVVASVMNVTARGNGDGDQTGLEIDAGDAGTGLVTIIGSDIADGLDTDGIKLTMH